MLLQYCNDKTICGCFFFNIIVVARASGILLDSLLIITAALNTRTASPSTSNSLTLLMCLSTCFSLLVLITHVWLHRSLIFTRFIIRDSLLYLCFSSSCFSQRSDSDTYLYIVLSIHRRIQIAIGRGGIWEDN